MGYQLVPQLGAHLYEIAVYLMYEIKMKLTSGAAY